MADIIPKSATQSPSRHHHMPLRLLAGIEIKFLALSLILGVALRVALALSPLTTTAGISAGGWVGIFLYGALNDLAVTALLLLPLFAWLLSAGRWKFRKPQCYVILALLATAWVVLKYFTPALAEFNRGLHRAIGWIIVFWIATFALRTFMPRIRRGWMVVWTAIIIGLYLGVLLMNCAGEWLFWDEFGVRYNFIAVDYLIYTTEVIGNIRESYNMPLIISAVVVAAGALEWILFRHDIKATASLSAPGAPWKLKAIGCYAVQAAVALIVLPLGVKMRQGDSNTQQGELQASGPYSFYEAFFKNELDYKSFYVTADEETIAQVARELASRVTADSAAITPNIVLITMESMSADYMARYGSSRSLTPSLDSLAVQSLTFDRMLAAGNRTVRGLEALTLSRPPSPGESLIKRPGGGHGLPSIADNLRKHGYRNMFLYGGDSYFDNMKEFYQGQGYEIVDRNSFSPNEITCATVWGVCDGDVYAKLSSILDQAAALGNSPLFIHLMTTSNHRPYIYPDGVISIPPSAKSREGGVMYSDYALGQFIANAKGHKWFDNTVFVIVADHCASSAGSTELPLERYHIPAMIYNLKGVEPSSIERIASQADIFPTLFPLLGWAGDSRLYGNNVLGDSFRERAFIATYQDMGYLENDTLTVLSPGRKVRQRVLRPTVDNVWNTEAVEEKEMSRGGVNRAAALYQLSSSKD